MACGESDDLLPLACEERAVTDENCAAARSDDLLKVVFSLEFGNFDSVRTAAHGSFGVAQLVREVRLVRVKQHRDFDDARHKLLQQFNPLGASLPGEESHSGHVAFGPVQAAD